MKAEVMELKERAFDARAAYKMGLITRSEAAELIKPYIKVFNEKSKEIAGKYNMRPKTISFASFVR